MTMLRSGPIQKYLKTGSHPTVEGLMRHTTRRSPSFRSVNLLLQRNYVSDQSNYEETDVTKFWKTCPETGRSQRPIYVAATKQHVGKTSTSLALVSGLKKRYCKVGFIKPVGQQHVEVKSSDSNTTLRVDKDVCLMKNKFKLDHIDYKHMSPVIIPPGYTKKFIDGEIRMEDQLDKVLNAFENISKASDVVLCEGTGHCAVGSIVGVNNAKVASLLGADMVLVANGGLGSAFDELELNRVLCQQYNVRIAGVVINKVRPDKYDQTKTYMSKVLRKHWGVPLLGCIPDRPFLGCPALWDLENLFKTKLISGKDHRFRHYSINDIILVTTNLTRFLANLRDKPTRTLYVCHVTRDDLILGFMAEYQRRLRLEEPFESALIVCGRKGKYEIPLEVKEMISGIGAPVMITGHSTHEAMKMIYEYTPKFNSDDLHRVTTAVDHYEPFINFEELLRRSSSNHATFNEPDTIKP